MKRQVIIDLLFALLVLAVTFFVVTQTFAIAKPSQPTTTSQVTVDGSTIQPAITAEELNYAK